MSLFESDPDMFEQFCARIAIDALEPHVNNPEAAPYAHSDQREADFSDSWVTGLAINDPHVSLLAIKHCLEDLPRYKMSMFGGCCFSGVRKRVVF